MTPISIELPDLVTILNKTKISTLDDLKEKLGTTAERTIFRKLKQLSYRTSYTHGCRYFTLDQIAEFNEDGLWCYDSVWFSRYGTLINTLEVWIAESDKGFFATELEKALHVSVRQPLLKLVQSDRIARKKISGLYLYCSSKPSTRENQISQRYAEEAAEEPSDELKAAIILFYSLCDEKQRRLFAGLESMRHGKGGDTLVAQLFGVAVHTVAKGRKQLINSDIEMDSIRAPGGGRKKIQKKFPTS